MTTITHKQWYSQIASLALSLAGGLALLTLPLRAAEAPARPTINELKPVMELAAAAAFQVGDKAAAPKTEIVEIGAPGWAPLTSPTSEDIFWPVKVKCASPALGMPSGIYGRSGSEEMVLVFRVYRVGTEWKADNGEIYTAISLSTMLRSRQIAIKNACINNLRQLDGAKEQWALENRKTITDTPTEKDLIGTDRYIKVKPVCPAGGTYTFNPMSKQPECFIKDHTLNPPNPPSQVISDPISAKNACINNLRQLDGAKEQWALENKKTATDTPVPLDLYGQMKYIRIAPRCPAGGTYQINSMVTKPKCSVTGHELPEPPPSSRRSLR